MIDWGMAVYAGVQLREDWGLQEWRARQERIAIFKQFSPGEFFGGWIEQGRCKI